MPTIIPSADLRNNYTKISEECHKYNEPVFVTKNGKGDLVLMSIEAYDKLNEKTELYSLIQEGIAAEEAGKVRSFEEFFEELRGKYDEV